MKIWKSLAAGGVILAATGGALALMFWSEKSEGISGPEEPIWDVRTVSVLKGDFRPQIKLIGEVEPVQDQTELAQVSAQVTQLFFEDGMQVAEGDLILTLDDFDTQLQLQQAQADLAELDTQVQLQRSQQQLDLQALEVEKAQLALLKDQLVKQQTISTQQALDDLKQQVQRQQFTVLQREAAIKNHPANTAQLAIQKQKLQLVLASAKRAVEHTRVTAPFDGTLAQVFVSEGERLSLGAPLFRIYSQDELSVQAYLPARFNAQRAQLDGMAQEQDRVSPVVFERSEAVLNNGQSGFKSWFSLTDASSWLPGDIAFLTLKLAVQENTYQVPAASVFQDRWIYAVDNEQRLKAIGVKVLGSAAGSEPTLVIEPQTLTDDAMRLLVTRLNNPTTGMKIYEAGVDPEPVEKTENADNEADEVNDENQG